MPQLLFPAAFPEGITFVRTYAGVDAMHIGELPGGGYSRIDGQPIQSVKELTAVIPKGPRLTQALEWWEHREDAPPEDEPPAVMWRKGVLVYVETGVELRSRAEIIQAFPDESPMQRAALEWFGQRQAQRNQAKTREELGTGVVSGPVAGGTPKPPLNSQAGRMKASPRDEKGRLVKRDQVQVRTPLNT